MKTNLRPIPAVTLLTLLARLTALALLAFLLTLTPQLSADPIGTAFTYQGRLTDGTNAAAGYYDLRCILYNADIGGSQVGPVLTNVVAVSGGLFTTALDFGTGVFDGTAYWLDLAVRTNGSGAFLPLSPRQSLTPTPYALFAPSAGTAASVPAANLTGTLADARLSTNVAKLNAIQTFTAANTFSSAANSFTGNGAGLTNVNADELDGQHGAFYQNAGNLTGTLADARLSTNVALLSANQVFSGTVGFSGSVGFGGVTGFNPAGGGTPFLVGNATKVVNLNADLLDGSDASAFWNVAGNAGTTAGLQFLGTTDNQPLELKVNKTRAMRLEPTLGPPNVIGGAAVNLVSPGAAGVTIAGGGTPDYGGLPQPNTVGTSFGAVGGGFGNSVGSDAEAATISGGARNAIQTGSSHAVIAGGADNRIESEADHATISGGRNNVIQTTARDSVVAGGRGNVVQGLTETAVMGGGAGNTVGTNADSATIGGGDGNAIGAGSIFATVGGGWRNAIEPGARAVSLAGGYANTARTDSHYATLAGGFYNTVQTNSPYSAVAGGQRNTVLAAAEAVALGGGASNMIGAAVLGGAPLPIAHATVAGGLGNLNQATAASIGGGQGNQIWFSSKHATIAGGAQNIIQTNSPYSALAGGHGNTITPNTEAAALGGGAFNSLGLIMGGTPLASTASTISGGLSNTISGDYSTIGGGQGNVIAGFALHAVIGGGLANFAAANKATVGGGQNNWAEATLATVAGGGNNDVHWEADSAAIGGGQSNYVAAPLATVAGGMGNSVTGERATIGGGGVNLADAPEATVAGGYANWIHASGYGAAIGGGWNNEASGTAAAVPGGAANTASGDNILAAGMLATATHNGTFVWADSRGLTFASSNANEFAVRCTGGARFVSAIDTHGNPTAGVYLPSGGGAWSSISDRHAKDNLAPVDARAVLEKVAALPLATWNYKSQDQSIRHLGPMAHDFHAAFGVGENDTTISTVDADGVALAAIQGLNQKVETRSQELEEKNAALEREVTELKALVNQLSAKLNGGGQ
jgi:hypothetical protein